MKKLPSPFIFLLACLLVSVSLACSLSTPREPQAPQAPESTSTDAIEEALPTLAPAATSTLQPVVEPTAEPVPALPNGGQIVYLQEGTIWRYIVDSGQSIQADAYAASGERACSVAQLSDTGTYLAYEMDGLSYLHNLVDGSVRPLLEGEHFIQWAPRGETYFVYRGDLECPPGDNLDDQRLINFDLLRYSLDGGGSSELLANIGGGLNYPRMISGDGQWASILHCACYSECGSEELVYLPSAAPIAAPGDLFILGLAFSPDAQRLSISEQYIYPQPGGALHVANIDTSAAQVIFTSPEWTPGPALWSPNQEWIAFTAFSFTEDLYSINDSQVMLIRPDGSEQRVVEGNLAYLVDWSPDGGQLLYRQGSGDTATVGIYDLATGSKTLLPFAGQHRCMDWGRLP